MSDSANLFLPYLRRGEFATLVKAGLNQAPAINAFAEAQMSESDLVSVNARVHAGSKFAWAGFLSRACSGFCVALDHTVSIFYSGQHLNDNPKLDWPGCFAKIVGLQAVPPTPVLQEEICSCPVLVPVSEVWTRAAFLFTTARDAKANRKQLRGWDWSEQSTPTASISILIADRAGPSDTASLSALSKSFGNYGTAVEFDPSGSCRAWWMDPSSPPVVEDAPDAIAVLDAWHDLAKLAGEGAGCIRRPEVTYSATDGWK